MMKTVKSTIHYPCGCWYNLHRNALLKVKVTDYILCKDHNLDMIEGFRLWEEYMIKNKKPEVPKE